MRRSKAGSAKQQTPEELRGNFTPPPSRAASSPRGGGPADLRADSPGSGGTGSRFAVRNWRVPTRLNAILLIPVIVALIFGGFQVKNSVETWNEAEDAKLTAELVAASSVYGNALINERDRTAEPLLKGKRNAPEVQQARDVTDKAKREFDSAVDRMPDKAGLQRRVKVFRDQEPKLEALRETAYTSEKKGAATEEGYVTIQHPLMEFANELGFGTGNVTSYGRTVYAISLSKAAESLDRALGMHLLIKPGPTAKDKKQQLTAFASYAYLENVALGEFTSGGLPEDLDLLKKEFGKVEAENKRKASEARSRGEVPPPSLAKMTTAIGSGAHPAALKSMGITQDNWYDASTARFHAYEKIESKLTTDALEETEEIASDARRDVIVNSAVVLLALLLAFFVAGVMARSMSRNMLRLRNAAFDVAEQRLPELVDQLSRTDPGRIDTRVAPMPIDSGDEIGEVARAFDQVHREAVRLASEQAMLRGNVNAIFTNLSRRNQGLIERQLGYITDLENNEADPDQLENLFRLDHLATRMRRNGENLLVLAGEEPGRRWTQPVPLVDILRAASSEVEYYERVEVSGVPETEIHGQVVNDLVHLLAELLENATSFSSPQTKVHVTATRLPDGRIMIEIHDKGIGLTAEDFADINHKLANPPVVDAAVSQRMGLFVVGRLADRHGIRVQLRPSGEQTGTTSLVMIPEAMTHGGGGEAEMEENFHVSRIMQEQEAPEPQQLTGGPSAAELGFDDSRFNVPDDLSSLDPLTRAQQREQRRAALEGGPPGPQQTPGQEFGRTPDSGQPEGARPPGLNLPARDPALYREPLRERPQEPVEEEPQAWNQAGLPQQSGGPQEYQQPQLAPYEREYGSHRGDAEPWPGVAGTGEDRVGFDRSGPSPSAFSTTTGSGLPRRERGRVQEESPAAQAQPEAEFTGRPLEGGGPGNWSPGQQDSAFGLDSGWHSSPNDERRDRAEALREPQAGGVTSSGLPRRVPRANLVEGSAEESPPGGPSVSRAPEDVRGRLSNLHRGVRRGRSAGDANQNDRQGFGPGSTYDQER